MERGQEECQGCQECQECPECQELELELVCQERVVLVLVVHDQDQFK